MTKEKINRKYLSAAAAVTISTLGSPLAFAYSSALPENVLPYGLCAGYIIVCSGVGYNEIYKNRKSMLDKENPSKFCDGEPRLSIEELVSRCCLSLDE